MKTLTIANKKGGVAKSTITCLTAHYLSSLGHRVLVLDLDEKNDTTNAIEASGKALISATPAVNLFTDPAATVEAESFVVMPGSPALATLESQPDQRSVFARNLLAFLARHAAQFDYCVVDTNPSGDIRVLAALVASNFVLAPFQANRESVNGLRELFNDPRSGLAVVKAKYNPSMKFIGLLPSMLENTKYQQTYLEKVMAVRDYREQLLTLQDGNVAFIPKRAIVQEVQGMGGRLWEVRGARRDMAKAAWENDVRPVIHRVAELVGAA